VHTLAPSMSMKKAILAVVAVPLIVAMTLGAMYILVRATVIVSSLSSPVLRGAAFGAELLLGVVLLLSTVWLATHMAVHIFTPSSTDPGREPPHAGK
jgi:hypothetical protein